MDNLAHFPVASDSKTSYTAIIEKAFKETGKPISIAKLANDLGVDSSTLRKYVPPSWGMKARIGSAPNEYWKEVERHQSKVTSMFEETFKKTKHPVSILGLSKRLGLTEHIVRKFIPHGWVVKRGRGVAPSDYWDKKDSNNIMIKSKIDIPVIPTNDVSESASLFSMDAYHLEIRNMWDSIRTASNDESLKELREDILVLKEELRKHLNEVMKKL